MSISPLPTSAAAIPYPGSVRLPQGVHRGPAHAADEVPKSKAGEKMAEVVRLLSPMAAAPKRPETPPPEQDRCCRWCTAAEGSTRQS